jgi:hypothetical protein
VEFQKIFGTTIIAGMGPAGSGLFNIPERLLRHFTVIHIPKLQDETMKHILESLIAHNIGGGGQCFFHIFGPLLTH